MVDMILFIENGGREKGEGERGRGKIGWVLREVY